MFNTFKARLLALVAAAALLPAMSAATTVSISGARIDQALKLPEFLAPMSSPSVVSASVPSMSFSDDPGLPVFLPSDAARRNPLSSNLRRSVDLSLWNLVAAVNAQQRGDSFELVEVGVTSLLVSQPNVDPLSTVPLPPAVWLFVMGTLGLAGTRITGLSGGARTSDDPTLARDLSRDFAGALPA